MSTDQKTWGSEMLLYFVGNCVNRLYPFVVMYILTVHLSKADYGIFAIAQMLRTFTLVLPIYVIENVVIKFYHASGSEDERAEVLGAMWLALVALLSVGMIAVEFSGPWIFASLFRGVPYYPYGRYVIWASYLVAITSTVPLGILKARRAAREHVLLTSAAAGIQIICIVLLIWVEDRGVVSVLRGLLYASGLQAVAYLWVISRNVRFGLRLAEMREALAFGLPLIPDLLGLWVLGMADRVVLNWNVSLASVGVYAVGYQVAMTVNIAVNAFDSVWYPLLLSRNSAHDDALKEVRPIATFVVAGVLLIGTVVASLGGALVRVLASPEYRDAEVFVPWVAVGLVALGVSIIPRAVLMRQSRTVVLAVATWIGAITNVGLNYYFVPIYGTTAAAINTCIAYVVALIATLSFAGEPGLRLFDRLPIAIVGTFCVAGYLTNCTISTTDPLHGIVARGGVLLVVATLSFLAVDGRATVRAFRLAKDLAR